LRALDDLVRAGRCLYQHQQLCVAVMESLWAAKELGLNRFVTEQPPYHLLDRSIERELIPMAQTYGLAILPWSPLARGFLSGKYQRGRVPPVTPRKRQQNSSAAFVSHTAKHSSDMAPPTVFANATPSRSRWPG
jgi:aryl-alcohol dehydrogenase-like predicted oxidoreductase